MTKDFDVYWEGVLPGSPQRVWDAITKHSVGWQWKIEYEPRVGGAERGLTGRGTVTVWDPPLRFTTRAPDRDGYNELDYRLEAVPDGTHLRYHHHGVAAVAEYDVEVVACQAHTDFYYHSLGEYVRHFHGREPGYVTADAPAASATRGFAAVREALGIDQDVTVGRQVRLAPLGLRPIEGVVDYVTEAFLGIRGDEALYRFYGRDVWGWPVSVAHHLFGVNVDQAGEQRAWQAWLDDLYASGGVRR